MPCQRIRSTSSSRFADLRGRREALTPADVGLVTGPRRRTAGLRLEEVAQLACMSVDYYSQLENCAAFEDSVVWKLFLGSGYREVFQEQERDRQARLRVANLRATSSRRRGDSDVTTLVNGLSAGSAEFRELWGRHRPPTTRSSAPRTSPTESSNCLGHSGINP